MNNDSILNALEMTAKLMELHEENPFKIRAYTNAAFKLSKLRFDFVGKGPKEIESIDGIGKGIAARITELLNTGNTGDLKVLLDKTPTGVVELLNVKGLGPKKVRQLWLELQIENPGELLYACSENRLITLKGFGEKTQKQVQASIEFKLGNSNKHHYASIEAPVKALLAAILKANPSIKAEMVGQLARRCEIIEEISILLNAPLPCDVSELESSIPLPVTYNYCSPDEFYYKMVELTSTAGHLKQIGFEKIKPGNYAGEAEVYSSIGLQFIPAELREGLDEVQLAKEKRLPELITMKDLRGILHNHTTYSDGIHTLKEMADYCRSLGYGYLGICDHSKTAIYAQGLSIERVYEQQAEIDKLNEGYKDFRILKGIESDILGDGSLDYPDEVLKTFDFVVASVHSSLKMTEEKATARLLKAIENPYTSILGHPSGRLLLARPGYPLDYRKIIDACAANKVTIELNAHPYRLDIDWRWIPYCLEKGVKISINPDAHQKEGFHDMYYGVCVARKGRLDKGNCLNAMELEGLLQQFRK